MNTHDIDVITDMFLMGAFLLFLSQVPEMYRDMKRIYRGLWAGEEGEEKGDRAV